MKRYDDSTEREQDIDNEWLSDDKYGTLRIGDDYEDDYLSIYVPYFTI
jgi:hypothetical protein